MISKKQKIIREQLENVTKDDEKLTGLAKAMSTRVRILSSPTFIQEELDNNRQVVAKFNQQLDGFRMMNQKRPTREDAFRDRAYWMKKRDKIDFHYGKYELTDGEKSVIAGLITSQCPSEGIPLNTKICRPIPDDLVAIEVSKNQVFKDHPIKIERHEKKLADAKLDFEQMHQWRAPAFDALVDALPENDPHRDLLPGSDLDPRGREKGFHFLKPIPHLPEDE